MKYFSRVTVMAMDNMATAAKASKAMGNIQATVNRWLMANMDNMDNMGNKGNMVNMCNKGNSQIKEV